MSLSKGTGTGTSTTGTSADTVELAGNADEHGTYSVSGTWTDHWSSCAANVALVDKQSELCSNRSGLAVKELVEGERIVRAMPQIIMLDGLLHSAWQRNLIMNAYSDSKLHV